MTRIETERQRKQNNHFIRRLNKCIHFRQRLLWRIDDDGDDDDNNDDRNSSQMMQMNINKQPLIYCRNKNNNEKVTTNLIPMPRIIRILMDWIYKIQIKS